MRRVLGCSVLCALVLLAAADGGSARHFVVIRPVLGPLIHPAPPSPTALRFPTAANRRFAHEDVQRLMRILVLPRGARLVAKVPRSAPRFRTELAGTRLRGFAVTRRIWVVHQPLERVIRFVRAHAHPRPRPVARFRGQNYGIRFRAVGSYLFPPVPGRSWERWLNVDIVPLSSGGTAVIAQAGDAWVHTPPRSALLPAAVRRIDIVSRFGDRHPNVLVHLRNGVDVGQIVALMNGLGLADTEHIACAAVLFGGPTVTLRFRAANGSVLARAHVPDQLGLGRSGPCNPLLLTIGDRKVPPLIGADLLLRIQRLLNVDLDPRVPRDAASCLHRHGWKVQTVIHNRLVDKPQHFPPELTATKHGHRWTITFHRSGKVTLDRTGPRGLERCLRGSRRPVVFGG